MFRQTGGIRYQEAEISAGSFAVDQSRLVVGTFSGWAAFDMKGLKCTWSEPNVLPSGCDVKGIQLAGEDALMLGYTRQQSADSPRNWGAQVLSGRPGSKVQLLHELPAGNWRHVRRVSGNRIYVYDVSEAQGVRAYERDALVWSTTLPDVRVVAPSLDGLVCLSDERVSVLSRDDGATILEHALPELGRYSWTTANVDQFETLIVGGYNRESKAFAVAVASYRSLGQPQIFEHPLERVFSAETIERAIEDECCGIDLFHVARVECLSADRVLLALGGGGEELGACQSAAALGLLNLERPAEYWFTQVIDEQDGISGLAMVSESLVLVDLCGALRFFAF